MAIFQNFRFYIIKGNFMQQNFNTGIYQNPCPPMPAMNPNAVNINIVQPQAYGSASGCASVPNYYPLYQPNNNPNLPLYPMNYNNMIHYPMQRTQVQPQSQYATHPDMLNSGFPVQQAVNSNQGIQPQNQQTGLGNDANAYNSTNLIGKTSNGSEISNKNIQENIERKETSETKESKSKDKEKTITILTDDYIKSLENYLNDSNPKVRLIAAKDIMERFKEDDSRIANPSLVALLNKTLRDTSPSVRFLGLTTLQLGYSIGNEETIGILKDIQTNNQDKLGEDSLLASEILLKLSAPKIKEVK